MRRMVIPFLLVLPLVFAALPLVGVAVWGDEAETATVAIPREPLPGTEPVGFELPGPLDSQKDGSLLATVECDSRGADPAISGS